MSTTTLISSVYKDYTKDNIATYVNQEGGYDFEDFGEAVLALGIAAIADIILAPLASNMANRIKSGITITGYAIGVAAIAQMFKDNDDIDARQAVIDEINQYGGKMRVYSELYEYTTGSGNATTRYVETRYERV